MSDSEDERFTVPKLGSHRTISVIVDDNRPYLDEMREELYRQDRKDFLQWLHTQGKDPAKGEGYSAYTVWETNYKTAKFERFTWDYHDKYKFPPDHDDANAWNEALKMRDVKTSTKGKEQEAILRYYRWLDHKGLQDEWDIAEEERFSSTGSNSESRPDYLDSQERKLIREAAIDYCGDWKRVSMVWASLDCAFRPIEVERAKDYWFHPERSKVEIPEDETSKDYSDGRQVRQLGERGAKAVSEWLTERENDPMYEGRDEMWLTREGNPYNSKELGRLMRSLADEAGIEHRGRQMTWYVMRHSTGTLLSADRGLKAAKRQLGHMDIQTTKRYDNVTDDEIQDSLDRMS